MNLKSKKGFTLVELIIVIAILGIIALIAVPNLTGIQQRSQVKADIDTAAQIGKAARIYVTETKTSLGEDWVLYTDADNGIPTTYISADYVPESYKGSGTAGYYVCEVNMGTGETRIVVAIAGSDDGAKVIYDIGDAAGIAYVEGASTLENGVAAVSSKVS